MKASLRLKHELKRCCAHKLYNHQGTNRDGQLLGLQICHMSIRNTAISILLKKMNSLLNTEGLPASFRPSVVPFTNSVPANISFDPTLTANHRELYGQILTGKKQRGKKENKRRSLKTPESQPKMRTPPGSGFSL